MSQETEYDKGWLDGYRCYRDIAFKEKEELEAIIGHLKARIRVEIENKKGN